MVSYFVHVQQGCFFNQIGKVCILYAQLMLSFQQYAAILKLIYVDFLRTVSPFYFIIISLRLEKIYYTRYYSVYVAEGL